MNVYFYLAAAFFLLWAVGGFKPMVIDYKRGHYFSVGWLFFVILFAILGIVLR